mmetsp:Transcript_51269/g.130319  ORF Transcript_51269/g.130319 Transcript_51269/m.130319 type:complete len:258 (+) Transcript_51269:771-1544(+)
MLRRSAAEAWGWRRCQARARERGSAAGTWQSGQQRRLPKMQGGTSASAKPLHHRATTLRGHHGEPVGSPRSRGCGPARKPSSCCKRKSSPDQDGNPPPHAPRFEMPAAGWRNWRQRGASARRGPHQQATWREPLTHPHAQGASQAAANGGQHCLHRHATTLAEIGGGESGDAAPLGPHRPLPQPCFGSTSPPRPAGSWARRQTQEAAMPRQAATRSARRHAKSFFQQARAKFWSPRPRTNVTLRLEGHRRHATSRSG